MADPEAVHPHCPKCGRPLAYWPLERGIRCAPADWVNCIRSDPRLSRRIPADNTPILEPCSCGDPECDAQVEFIL